MNNNTTIKLHLDKHCIETTAKNKLKLLSDNYMLDISTGNSIETLEKEIELLLLFLNDSNFKKLRASDIRLSGEVKSLVKLFYNEFGDAELKILE